LLVRLLRSELRELVDEDTPARRGAAAADTHTLDVTVLDEMALSAMDGCNGVLT
jgi:hypothetical protein